MKCKLGLSYKKPLGSIDAMDARIMCQVSFIRLMLGTMCNMCFESNSRPSFANGLELAQYWKANQQCTLANYFKNYGLTCSPKIKTILMLLHEIHHILMCSLAHEKSIWRPWRLLNSYWSKPSWMFLIILLIIGPFDGLGPWVENEPCNGFGVDPSQLLLLSIQVNLCSSTCFISNKFISFYNHFRHKITYKT